MRYVARKYEINLFVLNRVIFFFTFFVLEFWVAPIFEFGSYFRAYFETEPIQNIRRPAAFSFSKCKINKIKKSKDIK